MYVSGMKELIIIRGPIGAGKTSVVRSLCQLLPNSSGIECDAIKRMIDPHESSEWRRDIAIRSGVFLAGQLLRINRTAVAEIHANRPDQLAQFRCIGRDHNVEARTYLLKPPLDICLERVRGRFVPDISYAIDDSMVREHYGGILFEPGEREFDSSAASPELIASEIAEELTVTI